MHFVSVANKLLHVRSLGYPLATPLADLSSIYHVTAHQLKIIVQPSATASTLLATFGYFGVVKCWLRFYCIHSMNPLSNNGLIVWMLKCRSDHIGLRQYNHGGRCVESGDGHI
eukprot:6206803-Pleurochrysis_carterae.AAC.1